MIKLNQFKRIILLIGLLSFGLSTIISQPYASIEITSNEMENSEETVSNYQMVHNFQLYDADGKLFRLSDYSGQVVVLSFVKNIKKKKIGHNLMKENQMWLEALTEQYPTDIIICGIKEMTDIPRIIPKAFIRSTLRKESFRFLIDWEGEVFNDYYINQLFTIMVIDANGQVYYKSSDEFSDSNFSKLSGKINKLIN